MQYAGLFAHSGIYKLRAWRVNFS